MKILVTGCAGFIGWKVSERLLSDGHAVVGLDNLNNAYDVRLKEWRLQQLKSQPKFEFFKLDIRDRNEIRDVFKPGFDAVINLAARAGVRQSVDDPWIYFETNVTGTLNVLELCREFGVKKFVLASTSSLYGTNNSRPFREDTNTDAPLSPYAASKKGAEALCYTHHYLYNIDVTILRYFTVYGPAGRPGMSIFRFVQWISEERPVLVYGNGEQSRDFTYVEDIAAGTVAALKPLGFEVINLGSDHPVTVTDVIQTVEGLVEKKALLEHQDRHPADVMATWADIGKAKQLLDWRPQTQFEEGMAQVVNWYQENRDWASQITTL